MSIVDNKEAFFDYFIEERYEAGLVLEGWEVKAIRAGRAQIKEAYVVVRNAEIFLIGSHISPLSSTSTHIHADPTRTRKLLLNDSEIRKLIGKVEQRGYTLVPLNMHFSKGRVKCEIGLARGKKQHDKREASKEKPESCAGNSPEPRNKKAGVTLPLGSHLVVYGLLARNSQVCTTLSGLSEIEVIPFLTSHLAKSG